MWISVAFAATPPLPGAATLPPGVSLAVPFPPGTEVAITCGYGPTCSAFHDGVDQTCCTNDYYAVDFVRVQAGGGVGEPVSAVADGEVVYADWAAGGWSTFGRIVLIEHDFGDGHVYTSLYAHLSDLEVEVGQVVSARDVIGAMGGSGNYGDDYFSPHLHLSLYRDASFLGGPYGGASTVPEPLDGYEDLAPGDRLIAGSDPAPTDTGTPPGTSTEPPPADSGGGGTGDTGASAPPPVPVDAGCGCGGSPSGGVAVALGWLAAWRRRQRVDTTPLR